VRLALFGSLLGGGITVAALTVQASSARQGLDKPEAHTGGSSAVTLKTATLRGRVNPNGDETTYHFRYGLTRHYGHGTAPTSAGSGTTDVSVQAALTGLRFGHRYHYRLVAHNALGKATGRDRTFRTDDPRLTGDYRVKLHVVRGGRPFGQHHGTRVTRAYHFHPRHCSAGRCKAVKLNRRGRRGHFRSVLQRHGPAAFSGKDHFRGWCDDGRRFDSSTRVHVHAKTADGDRADRIAGSLRVRAHHCVHGIERAKLKGRAK
jgi:hypothetical protein